MAELDGGNTWGMILTTEPSPGMILQAAGTHAKESPPSKLQPILSLEVY